jgi:hypothetical protein
MFLRGANLATSETCSSAFSWSSSFPPTMIIFPPGTGQANSVH